MTDAAQTSIAGAAPRRSNGVLAAFSAACLPYAALGLPVYVTLPTVSVTRETSRRPVLDG